MDFCENKETGEYVYKYNDLVSNKFKYNWGFDYMIYDGKFLYAQELGLWSKKVPSDGELDLLNLLSNIENLKSWMECKKIPLDKSEFEEPNIPGANFELN